jgi:hypothetical protein
MPIFMPICASKTDLLRKKVFLKVHKEAKSDKLKNKILSLVFCSPLERTNKFACPLVLTAVFFFFDKMPAILLQEQRFLSD